MTTEARNEHNLSQLSLADMVKIVCDLDAETYEIKDRPRPSGINIYRETVRGMRRDRDNLVLEMIRGKRSQVRVGLEQVQGESIHHYSQNRVIVDPSKSIGNAARINTSLDQLASAEGSMDSRVITNAIGNPDFVLHGSAKSYLVRTHEEVRSTERVFSIARKRGEAERLSEADAIKSALIERMLLELRPNPELEPLMHVVFNEAGKIEITSHLGADTRSTKISPNPQVLGWVIASGGFDRVEGNPQALQNHPRLVV